MCSVSMLQASVALVMMLDADANTTSALIRWLWGFFLMVFAVACVSNSFNKLVNPTLDETGKKMQLFNIGIWFLGNALAHKAMTGDTAFGMLKKP